MFDPDLQLRFMRSATDAFFEGAEAMMAASRSWQAALPGLGGTRGPTAPVEPMPMEPFAAWSWALDLWRDHPAIKPAMPAQWPWLQSAAPKPTWPLQAFQMNSMWAMNTSAASFGGMSPPADPAALWSSMMTSYWTLPAVSWSLYQGPLTMMLVTSGLPYAIAGPTARASTAALDAADALRLQTIQTFAAFRTDGGHAATQLFAPEPDDRQARRDAKRRRVH
ncbi:MAG: hypothetical protein ACKVP4_13485 [Hyphomicrobium sp.]